MANKQGDLFDVESYYVKQGDLFDIEGNPVLANLNRAYAQLTSEAGKAGQIPTAPWATTQLPTTTTTTTPTTTKTKTPPTTLLTRCRPMSQIHRTRLLRRC